MYREFKLTPYLREYIESSLSESLQSIGFEKCLIQDLNKCFDDFNFEYFKNKYASLLDDVHELNFHRKILPDIYKMCVLPLIPKAEKVLDLGCGNGILSKILFEAGNYKEILGIDVVEYPEWNEFRNKKLDYKLVERKDFNKFILDYSPDVVVLTWVLHHMEFNEQQQYICEMKKILKKGATIVVLEDSYSEKLNPKIGLDHHKLFMEFSPEDRLTIMSILDFVSNRVLSRERTCPVTFTYRTLEKWKQVFESTGFNVVSVDYLGFPTPKNINTPQSVLVAKL